MRSGLSVIGPIHESAGVRRVRRIVGERVPPYLERDDFRVYVAISDHSQSSARARNLRREIALNYPDVKLPPSDNPALNALDKAIRKNHAESGGGGGR